MHTLCACVYTGAIVIFAMSLSQDSDVVGNHRVRMIDILHDEEAVIRVRTKFHVSLVFDSCTIEMFEKDGVVYTRQECSKPMANDDESCGEAEYGGDLDTQKLDEDVPDEDPLVVASWFWNYTTPTDPPVVIEMAGGSFDCVNEKHAARLECSGNYGFHINNDLDDEYLDSGGTQIECSDSSCYVTNLDGGYFEETQIEIYD